MKDVYCFAKIQILLTGLLFSGCSEEKVPLVEVSKHAVIVCPTTPPVNGDGVYDSDTGIINAANSDGAPDGTLTDPFNGMTSLTLTYPAMDLPGEVCVTVVFSDAAGVVDVELNGLTDSVTNPAGTVGVPQEVCVSTQTTGTQIAVIMAPATVIAVDGSTYGYCPLDTDGDGDPNVTDPDDDEDGTLDGAEPGAIAQLDRCLPVQLPGCVEVCSNGIDDDGDGLTDIWDSDCPCEPGGAGANACPSTCTYQPTPQAYQPGLLWTGQAVDARETPLVGDVDGDGTPEVIVDNYTDTLYVLSGADGSTEHTIPVGDTLASNNSSNAIADVDKDGFGEIVVVLNNPRYLRMFTFDGTAWTTKWTTTVAVDNTNLVPGFADFNADGVPEVFVGDEIFSTVNGGKIGEGNIAAGDGELSVAIDLFEYDAATCPDCDGLELILGSHVFGVDITAGTVTERVGLSAKHGIRSDFRR